MDPPAPERRCHHCGALVGEDATWCGQCFTSLERPPPPSSAVSSPVDRDGGGGGRPGDADGRRALDGDRGARLGGADRAAATWPCPTCGTDNPIDLDACSTCGTPFGSLLSLAPARRSVAPRDALAWSLVYPGVGHQRMGLGLDGLARGILFTMTFGMALLIALGGVTRGPIFAVFIVYLLLALGSYGLTAWEAYRVAGGAPLFVPSRPLMWATVALMLVSVVTLALTVATTARG